MAGEELQLVRLKDDFYRDGFYKVLIALATNIIAIVFLIGISIYLYLSKPAPVYFSADNEWRILPPVPVDKEYLSIPDLLQWVSEALPNSFNYDFIHYTDQLKNTAVYYTKDGWEDFLTIVNKYASYNTVVENKIFVNASALAAPIIKNRGLDEGRFTWWVEMPLSINYSNGTGQELNLKIFVVRVPTLNNLYGVSINHIEVLKGGSAGGNANA